MKNGVFNMLCKKKIKIKNTSEYFWDEKKRCWKKMLFQKNRLFVS